MTPNRDWKEHIEQERRILRAEEKVMRTLQQLSPAAAKRVVRVITACYNAGCLSDLGAILRGQTEGGREP